MHKVSKKQRKALRAMAKLPTPNKPMEHQARIRRAMERERQTPRGGQRRACY